MREVDRALARIYPRVVTGGGRRPAPGEPDGASAPPFRVVHGPAGPSWPATVRALERDHGPRFDRLADRMIEARDRDRQKIVLFTSGQRSEGRTTLVLTLSRFVARRPGRTLLVDADLGGPSLARMLDLKPRVGLEDVVEDDRPLADALIELEGEGLGLLPLRSSVPRPRDLLASAEWTCLMARLRREYDLILMDGGPLFVGLNAAVLHRSVDAAVLVYHRELTGERNLRRSSEVLEAGGVPLLGLAETFGVDG